MAQTTTNYGLFKPEATDAYNHLIYDNPNMDTIDAAMKANSNAAITSATCIKSGTTHTITRSNTDAAVMRFTATGDWNTGDTMVIDGVTVAPYLVTGEALKTGAFLINTEVVVVLSGTRATVLSNQSEAGSTYFDDTNVSFTAGNVEDAIEALTDANNIEYQTGVSVKDFLDVKSGSLVVGADYSTYVNTLYVAVATERAGVVTVSIAFSFNATSASSGYKHIFTLPGSISKPVYNVSQSIITDNNKPNQVRIDTSGNISIVSSNPTVAGELYSTTISYIS